MTRYKVVKGKRLGSALVRSVQKPKIWRKTEKNSERWRKTPKHGV